MGHSAAIDQFFDLVHGGAVCQHGINVFRPDSVHGGYSFKVIQIARFLRHIPIPCRLAEEPASPGAVTGGEELAVIELTSGDSSFGIDL